MKSLISFPSVPAKFVALLVCFAMSVPHAQGEQITLKNGVTLEGTLGFLDSLAAPALNPTGGGGNNTGIKRVIIVDDELRRTMVPELHRASGPTPTPNTDKRIKVPQRVAETGFTVNTVGPILKVTPFDEWGRRIYSMAGPKGRIDVVQGITEVTPTYTRLQGLNAATNYVWDMRIATSSLSRRELSRVLKSRIDVTKASDRLEIVGLYIQADRIQDARAELEEVVKDFPSLPALKEQVATLRQMSAQRLIREIEFRKAAGQHRMAFAMASEFPVEGIDDATILSVREIIADYVKQKTEYDQTLEHITASLKEITDDAARNRLQPYCQEIARDLNVNTMDRMADFMRLWDDPKLLPEQKVALAVSGWLLGSGQATEKTAIAMSLGEARDLTRDYMNTKKKVERDEIIYKLKSLDGGTPAYLAKIVANMKPAIDPPKNKPVPMAGDDPAAANADEEQEENGPPQGLHEIDIPGMGEDNKFTYYIQLPPEYDPYRKYPCIVTLHSQGSSPLGLIDWWAGTQSQKSKVRSGQATRQGYIVIAPKWTKDLQQSYEFSAREHAVVLGSLRDAMQKFSIDSNRVFLSGHTMGGDAVWDIGLAHPDLWAGVIAIGANVDKFSKLYQDNARYVPLYFIGGERDGSRSPNNGLEWDDYFRKAGKSGYDVMIVEYLGRGHEHFYDEIQRIFEWMKLHERNFFPTEFKVTSARAWDNFFWWVEIDDLPAKSVLSPYNFPTRLPTLASLEAKVNANNTVTVKSPAKSGRIYLSPKMLDFEKPIEVRVNNDRLKHLEPNIEVLLEDVRTRGDRQQPFWVKADFGNPR